MSQVPENLPPPPVSVDIPRGKSGNWPAVQKKLQVTLKDSESENYLGAKNTQGSDEEGSQPTE